MNNQNTNQINPTKKKYEFVEGDTFEVSPGRILKRIRAIVAIPEHDVMPGDLGGYIESEDNLSGNGWVSVNACVYGNAAVYGNARVYGDAVICGNAHVYGDAWVYDNARVFGRVDVGGNVRVRGAVTKTPLQIGGLLWPITICDHQMVIGCKAHAIGEWWSFSDEEIDGMSSGALEFWRKHKASIFALIVADGRFCIPA